MAQTSFSVCALQLEDVPSAAQIAADAFLIDRQTQMKALGPKPFLMKEYTLESLPGFVRHPRCIVLKAVDDLSGNIAGYCTWGFKGIQADDMPPLEGRVQPREPLDAPSKASSSSTKEDSDETAADDHTADGETQSPITKLVAMQDADMQSWMEYVMPPEARCMYVVGLSVSPSYQGHGVGSALLRWGTTVCDRLGIYAWVHSSELAWKMYEKRGFRTVRQLDIDLDEYSPAPPPKEGPDAKWGHYVLRYMRYDSKSTGEEPN